MSAPLAYHITWTAYGAWLHGDPRSWVETGAPCILPPDDARFWQARERMTEPPVEFEPGQRAIIARVIDEHCRRRDWRLHARNARSNHVHLVITADRTPEEVMNQLKAWCSRRLSDDAGLAACRRAVKAGRRKWFTEHGSTKWINDEAYFANAVRYVLEGQ